MRRWLLSLALCDVSLLITLRPLEVATPAAIAATAADVGGGTVDEVGSLSARGRQTSAAPATAVPRWPRQRQTARHAGVVHVALGGGSGGDGAGGDDDAPGPARRRGGAAVAAFAYCIAVVDVGPKPASRIRAKGEEEEAECHAAVARLGDPRRNNGSCAAGAGRLGGGPRAGRDVAR